MLRIVACLSLAVAVVACQPLYGAKADKLASLPKKPVPPEPPPAPEVPPKMSEDCTADFRGEPKNVRIQASASRDLTTAGENALINADKTMDPKAKVDLIKDGIDRLRNALIKDPYNAEATLKLALAYDRVYKKGCAIALLKRLASLTTNSKYAKDANLQMGSVDDNGQWFKFYRKDAIAAIGH